MPLSSKLLHHLLSAISDSLLLVQKIHPALHYNCTTSMYKTLAHTVSCVSEVSTCILHSCALALLSGCSGKLSFSAVYCGQLRIPSNVSTSILVYKLTITIKCMLRLGFCYSKMTIANIIISIGEYHHHQCVFSFCSLRIVIFAHTLFFSYFFANIAEMCKSSPLEHIFR